LLESGPQDAIAWRVLEGAALKTHEEHACAEAD